jgi:hypothetical protein
MPIQLQVWERRDNGNREGMGNASIELCRIVRKVKGITSCRFYWSGTEIIVSLTEGETAALNDFGLSGDQLAKFNQLLFTLADNAKWTLNLRLVEPRDAVASYRSAGR